MADPGFVSGFIGVGIDMTIHQILDHINIALRCTKELDNLKDLVRKIEPIIKEIQHQRPEFNRKKIPIPQSNNKPGASAVNEWLKTMDRLLQQASAMALQCTTTIPRCNVISRYKTSTKITRLISDITQHLQLVSLIGLAQTHELLERFAPVQELGASSALASTSGTFTQPDASMGFFINEPLILGQHNAFAALEKLVIQSEAHSPFLRIGVLGKGGSGKTLLLKTVFNSRKGKRFALFLDDLWDESAALLDKLGLIRLADSWNSKVVVSSRNHNVLRRMGVNADASTLITIEDLIQDDSWRLFVYHAFPHNNGNLPGNIEEEKAKDVCAKCGGLPLAIKAVGRAMSDIIDAQQWDLAVQRLPEDRLRLSYDALGNYKVNLQMCFLYLAATYPEDEIIYTDAISALWLGEGLLVDEAGHESFEIGRIYVNSLADRCLIEPTVGLDGSVQFFRMHDVVRSLGIQIGEQEENFYCGTAKGITTFDANQCLPRARIFLTRNELTLLPKSFRAPEI